MKVMDQNHCFMILDKKLNMSLLCVLPLIAKSNEKYTSYIEPGFENDEVVSFEDAYSSDINRPWLDEHLLMVYNTENQTPYSIMKTLENNENFIQEYVYRFDGKFYTIYAYKIPFEFEREYKLISDGKYSRLSRDTKIRILTFWSAMADSILFSILFPPSGKDIASSIKDDVLLEKDYIPDFLESLIDEIT
jgi:hypothetical protein